MALAELSTHSFVIDAHTLALLSRVSTEELLLLLFFFFSTSLLALLAAFPLTSPYFFLLASLPHISMSPANLSSHSQI